MKTLLTILKVIALVLSLFGGYFFITILMGIRQGGITAVGFMSYNIYSTIIYSAIAYAIAWVVDRQIPEDDTMLSIAKNVASLSLIAVLLLYIYVQVIF